MSANKGQHPPAEPGCLVNLRRSKRLEGSLTQPLRIGATVPVAGSSSPEPQLLQSLLSFSFESRPHLAKGRDEVSPRPEVLPDEVALCSPYTLARWLALLPLTNPTTCDRRLARGFSVCYLQRFKELESPLVERAFRHAPGDARTVNLSTGATRSEESEPE